MLSIEQVGPREAVKDVLSQWYVGAVGPCSALNMLFCPNLLETLK